MIVFPVMTKECDSETWGFLSVDQSEYIVQTGAHAITSQQYSCPEYEKYAYLAAKQSGVVCFPPIC